MEYRIRIPFTIIINIMFYYYSKWNTNTILPFVIGDYPVL